MENDFLKVGRINKEVERITGVVMTSGNSVYLSTPFLDKLTLLYKDKTEEKITLIRDVLACPDFVSFNKASRSFLFVYFLFMHSRFTPFVLRVGYFGKPQKLLVMSMSTETIDRIESLGEDWSFVRFKG